MSISLLQRVPFDIRGMAGSCGLVRTVKLDGIEKALVRSIEVRFRAWVEAILSRSSGHSAPVSVDVHGEAPLLLVQMSRPPTIHRVLFNNAATWCQYLR